MQNKFMDGHRLALAGLTALAALVGIGLSAADAYAKSSGTGAYYVEFRARYSWDDGHTYLIHARVGERLTAANVAGLSPVGDGETAWVIGHFIPVPATTGATDGDLEEKYVSARYRVYMDKAKYDRVVAYIRKLQARSKMWSLELDNCNAFVADVASYMGLRAPKSTWIYPRVFINNLRKINTHPNAQDTLFSDNISEMSSPTRDGRAMINNGIYRVHDGVYEVDPHRLEAIDPQARRTVVRHEPRPTVTIGRVHATNSMAGSVVASEPAHQ